MNTADSIARPWRGVLAVFVVAFAARAGWGVFQWIREGSLVRLEFPDEEQYWAMAGSLRQGDGLRDELGFRATRMPLYPAFLAPFTNAQRGVEMVQTVQWFIGALAAGLTAAWAARWGRRVGWLAGGFVALDPFLVFSSSLLLTETLFITALIGLWWSIWVAGRSCGSAPRVRVWLLVGVASTLCVYLRESSLGLVLVGLGWAVVSRRFDRFSLRGATLAVLLLFAALFPWALRNHRVMGEWVWLTTRGGISLYDGVSPEADGSSNLGDVKHSDAVRGLSEIEWDRYFRGEACKAVESDPARVFRLAVPKLARMWNPIPNVDTYRSSGARIVSAGWVVPLFILAAAGLLVLRVQSSNGGPRLAVFLLLPTAYLSVLHCVFVGSVRYRLPAMPFLEILAAVAVSTLVGRLARSGSPGDGEDRAIP